MTLETYNEQPVTKITNTLFIYNIKKDDHRKIHKYFQNFPGFYESKLLNKNNKLLLFIVFIDKIKASHAIEKSYSFIKELGYSIIYSRESTRYLEKRISQEEKTEEKREEEKINFVDNNIINEIDLYDSIYKLEYKNPSKTLTNNSIKWNNSLSIYKEDSADENWIYCYINNINGLRSAVVIYDKYPKGKYHLLLLPLINFASEPRYFTRDHLVYIKSFNNCARFIAKVLSDKYKKNFIIGYHKYPSMKDLHIHIVSDETIRKKKNKKFLDDNEFLSADLIEFHLEKYPDFTNIYP